MQDVVDLKMHTHFTITQKKKHPLALNVRELEIWCYKCDRFLEGSTRYELEKVKSIECGLLCQEFYQHRVKLSFISKKLGGRQCCSFCNLPGLHVKCIADDEEERRSKKAQKEQ